MAYGHLIRMAVWEGRRDWRADAATGEKLERVADFVAALGGWPAVERCLREDLRKAPAAQSWVARDAMAGYGGDTDAVSF